MTLLNPRHVKKNRRCTVSKLRSLAIDATILTKVGATALSHFRRTLENLSFNKFKDHDTHNGWELLEPFKVLKKITMECAVCGDHDLFAFLRSHPTLEVIDAPISFYDGGLFARAFKECMFRDLTSLILQFDGADFYSLSRHLYGLTSLEKLTSLNVMFYHLEIPFLNDVSGLGAMTQLEHLNLTGELSLVAPISKLTNLLWLEIHICTFTPEDVREDMFDPLSNLTRLKKLNMVHVSRNEAVHRPRAFDGMEPFRFLRSLNQLVELRIYCTPTAPIIPIMESLSRGCPLLETFTYRSDYGSYWAYKGCICGGGGVSDNYPCGTDYHEFGLNALKHLEIDADVPHLEFAIVTFFARFLEFVRIAPAQIRERLTLERRWETIGCLRGGAICEDCKVRRKALHHFYSDGDQFPVMKDWKIV